MQELEDCNVKLAEIESAKADALQRTELAHQKLLEVQPPRDLRHCSLSVNVVVLGKRLRRVGLQAHDMRGAGAGAFRRLQTLPDSRYRRYLRRHSSRWLRRWRRLSGNTRRSCCKCR